MKQTAIVLAGGLGTRLQQVVSEVPKPMAPVKGVPFLQYVLDHLQQNGIEEVLLSVGYLHEKISDYFGDRYQQLSLRYTIESKPLGTGGALNQAVALVDTPCFIVNGDTIFNVDLQAMKRFSEAQKADLTLALKPMSDFDRYGAVALDERQRILRFEEKKYCASGLINGGIYYLRRDVFAGRHLPEVFSFEKEILEAEAGGSLYGFQSDALFLDIGIPEDYARAATLL
ncbi:MAG: nucleotidyltransferase family protein [Chitinophagales bacterium]